MDIVLYNNTFPLNNIHRTLTTVGTISGHLKEGCNILSPDITINYNSTYLAANYAYIADFGRYYYYREAPTIQGDTMVLRLEADTLYNYLSEVLNAECIAERSSNRFNLMLKDSALLGEVGFHYFSRSFTGGESFTPDNGKYILMTGGR